MKFGGCVCQGCGNEFEGDVVGGHRVLVGDSTSADDVARAMDGAKPVLMVTDQPYGISYDATRRDKTIRNRMAPGRAGVVLNDDRADWSEAYGLFGGDVAYVWHGVLSTAMVANELMAAGFDLRSQIIWNKSVMVIGRGDYHWKHEACWYAVRKGKTGHWQGARDQTTVWDLASPIHIMGGSKEEKTDHPTQKPVEAMRRPIQNNTRIGDVVYDPFLGSGTTMIAAEMMGRFCIGIEMAPAYVDISVKRWQTYVEAPGLLAPSAAGHAVLAGDGRTFDQVARARRRGGDDAKGHLGVTIQRRKRAARAVAPVAQ